MDKNVIPQFLFQVDSAEFRFINLHQIVSATLDVAFTLRMSNGEVFMFSEKEAKLSLLRLFSDTSHFLNGASASSTIKDIVDKLSEG